MSILLVARGGGIDAWEYVRRTARRTGCARSILVFVLLLFAAVSEAQTEQTKHILILNSYHRGFQWTDDQTSAIEDVLTGSIDNLELYVEYMDTKRIYTPEYLEHVLHVCHLKYDKIKLDAVIATDDNALRFAIKYHEEAFSDTPVSFCSINDYYPAMLDGKDAFTGLIEVLDIKATIDLAMKLHKGIQTVYVITDNTPTGIGQQRDVQAVSKQCKDMEFKYLSGQNYSHSELLEKLKTLPENSVVLLTVWLRDKTNTYIPIDEGGPAISSASTVPVYGIITMYLEHGIVGGKLLSSQAQGTKAAELILRVLAGEKPADIGVITESLNPYMFDFAQLQRWNVDKTTLPADSIIVNEPISFYYRHRKLIWSTIAIVIVQSILIIAFIITIVLRRRAEAEIHKSRNFLQTIIDGIPDQVLVIDLDYRIVLANQAVREATGKTDIVSNGISCYQVSHHRDDPCEELEHPCPLKEVVKTGKPMTVTHTHYDANDNRIFIEVCVSPIFNDSGEMIHVIEACRDITERKQAEKALETEKDRLAKAQEIGSIGTWELDIVENLLAWTKESYNIFGVPDGTDLTYETFHACVHPDDREYVNNEWTAAVDGKPYDIEHRIIANGKVKWVREKAELSFDNNGKVIRAVGVTQDISERKLAEQEREDFLKTLESKNEELRSIVYIASHDLKSPLVNIDGFGGELIKSCQQLEKLMADAVFDETKAKEARELINDYIPESLKFIKAGTAKMSSLLAGLLRVSRVGTTKVEIKPIDMNKMLNRIVSASQFKAKECGATITVDDLPDCLGDETMINQIFSNLIDNALKYLDRERKPKIRISGRIEDANSIYCAEDNGIGIDLDHQGKIFEVFHRLNPADSAGGEGLGLTIIKRILDRLNGSIRVESEPGKGSKFFVSLPTVKI